MTGIFHWLLGGFIRRQRRAYVRVRKGDVDSVPNFW